MAGVKPTRWFVASTLDDARIAGDNAADVEIVKAFSRDTSDAAQRLLIEGYRRMSPAEKLECVRQMTQAAQQMALIRLRRSYPDAGERELQLRLASLWLTREQMRAAFDWDPDAEGR